MTLRIRDGVLSLAERHVGDVLQYEGSRTESLVPVRDDVLHSYVDVLTDSSRAWRHELAASTAQHDGSIANDQLRVEQDAVAFGAQALPESEGST